MKNNNILNPKNWIHLYADYLKKYAYFRVRNRELAEDLMQDTFVAALKSQNTYNGVANEKTWLTIILKNKIIDHYRSKLHKHNKITDSLDNNNTFFDSGSDYNWLEQKQTTNLNTTENYIESVEFNSILNDCLNKMPKKLSSIFTLKYIDDEAPESICKEFNITSSNYWVMLHRAKLQLRDHFETNWIRA